MTQVLLGPEFSEAGNRVYKFSVNSTMRMRPTFGAESQYQALSKSIQQFLLFGVFIIIIIIIYFNCKWAFNRWQWYYNKTQHK
jgi:hypothetical protein